jgi:hypothetical protein
MQDELMCKTSSVEANKLLVTIQEAAGVKW